MIAKLKGIMEEAGPQTCTIDVGGVCYLVHCSSKTLARLPSKGEPLTLYTEMIVREDAHLLCGFKTAEEREWYRLLTSVQGVGMRMALSLLSIGSPQDIADAILSQNKSYLTQADGVGPKLAERILHELKGKVAKMNTSNAGAVVTFPGSQPHSFSLATDAISALTNLGYRSQDVVQTVNCLLQESKKDATLESLIRSSLNRLAR